MLATQNPVDLDYKGLSNAGTWFIGRLQTERDRGRVIDGLLSAQAGAGFDRAALEKLMAGIAPRVFLMRNVNDDAPVLFRTRWALSWLRGPLTLPEITRLMAGRKSAEPVKPAASAPPAASKAARPALPAGVEEIFLAARPGNGVLVYRPRVAATAELHYADKPAGVDAWTRGAWLAPLADGDGAPDWPEATAVQGLEAVTAEGPVDGATFAEVPAAALALRSYAEWGKALAAHLYKSGTAELFTAKSLKLTSNSGRERGRLPRPSRTVPARAPRPRGHEAAREARGQAQVARGPAAARGRQGRAREVAVRPAQARHRDLDRHLGARRHFRRPQHRDHPRRIGRALRRARVQRAR